MAVPRVIGVGRIFAHRGASRTAPENTLAAFRTAEKQGVRSLEFDVSLIGGGVAVVHHDRTLDRCTDASGPLSALRVEDLATIDAGRWRSERYRGETIPTLDATLDLIFALGLSANLEIKPQDQEPALIAGIVARHLEARTWTRNRIVVSSFSTPALEAFRTIMPHQPLAMLWDDPPADWKSVARSLQAEAIHIGFKAISSELLIEARRERLGVRVFTINQPELMVPFRNLGLTGVITDHPPLFLDDPEWRCWSDNQTVDS